MAATKRHVNVKSVSFATTTIECVQSAEIDHRGSVISISGDDDRYPTTKYADFEDPAVTVRHRDIQGQAGKAQGATGSLVVTLLDADGTSTYVATMSNAILETKSVSAGHRQAAEGTMAFSAVSTDGTTNPLAYAAGS